MDKKKLVSIRVRCHDVDRIKEISQRIGVRESDLFRFAIRMLLARFAPLRNSSQGGRELLPLLMEFGTELAHYFELDAERLAWIVNQGVDDPAKRVDSRDIDLLIMSTVQENYAYLRLQELTDQELEPQGVNAMVRRYIYEKYLAKDTHPLPVIPESVGG
jgi:hypothetical protein